MSIGVAIVAFEDAQILDIAGPMEILRGANLALKAQRARGGPAYSKAIVANRKGPVRTSCGLAIVATDSFITAPRDVDTLIVAGGILDAALADATLLDYVRECAPRARRVAAIGTGTFVLAVAGLLEGRQATTHWRACSKLAERFPGVRVRFDQLLVRDGKFLTSAGASAALDQTLALVEEDLGREVCMAVAHRKVMFLARTGGESQVSAHLAAQMVGHEGIAKLTAWILSNIAKDIDVEMLAEKSAMSTRSVARLFSREVGMSPARFIERSRVEIARRLLEESDLRLDAIVRRTGMGNEERLRRAFRRCLGMSPREYRGSHPLAAEPAAPT